MLETDYFLCIISFRFRLAYSKPTIQEIIPAPRFSPVILATNALFGRNYWLQFLHGIYFNVSSYSCLLLSSTAQRGMAEYRYFLTLFRRRNLETCVAGVAGFLGARGTGFFFQIKERQKGKERNPLPRPLGNYFFQLTPLFRKIEDLRCPRFSFPPPAPTFSCL